jgi:hypothetical protein
MTKAGPADEERPQAESCPLGGKQNDDHNKKDCLDPAAFFHAFNNK